VTSRETVGAKAIRYLCEGHLRVDLVHEDVIEATCRGSEAQVYDLGLEAGEWWCSCPARGECAHLLALQLVTVRPASEESSA
jgi:hypothetical protein